MQASEERKSNDTGESVLEDPSRVEHALGEPDQHRRQQRHQSEEIEVA